MSINEHVFVFIIEWRIVFSTEYEVTLKQNMFICFMTSKLLKCIYVVNSRIDLVCVDIAKRTT